ncbi:MAG: VWA domain-containing protein [Rikenellaceae bacterium]
MQFASPKILYLLILVVPMVAYYIYKCRRGGVTLQLSTVEGVRRAPKTFRYYLRHAPFVLRIAAIISMIVALARPQDTEHLQNATTEGIDIVLAIDISTSMLARDFKPDRLTVSKQVAASFISDRVGDRIGLVGFAGESYTLAPLTTDKGALQTMLATLRSGVIEDGTAIGNGLATALNRMRGSTAESKVVILLTDGVNNRGEITPQTAAAIAKEMDVKVYTIGVGSMGEAEYPLFDNNGKLVRYVKAKVEIDEKTLRDIARTTGGEYFRATDSGKLKAIYDQINELEKSEVEIEELVLYHEKFLIWVVAALVLLALEFLVKFIILKRLP